MAGLGELIRYLFFGLLIFSAIVFGISAVKAKSARNRILFLWSCITCLLFLWCIQDDGKLNNRCVALEYVGTYLLTNYPNCDSCRAILDEDSFRIINLNDSTIEKGNWHFESGQDYLIVYLNGKNDQLGYGRFQYSYFIDWQNKRHKSPTLGP